MAPLVAVMLAQRRALHTLCLHNDPAPRPRRSCTWLPHLSGRTCTWPPAPAHGRAPLPHTTCHQAHTTHPKKQAYHPIIIIQSRWKLNNYWGGTPVFLGAMYAPGGFGVTRCMRQRCAAMCRCGRPCAGAAAQVREPYAGAAGTWCRIAIWRCRCWQVDNPASTFLANRSLSKPSNQAALSASGVPSK